MFVSTAANLRVFSVLIVHTKPRGSTIYTRTSVPATIWNYNDFFFHLLTGGIWVLGAYRCSRCSRVYKHHQSLRTHIRFECGIEPMFHCNYCPYQARRKHHLLSHMRTNHRLNIKKPFVH
ncbi:hypothetical protein BDFB_000080 [Asbolus verrucosus]|uniref:C2H2-type domain-containing protein n=1 Tax=Asbolus verrucosus TaxID=1661398 RepID=A0A482V7L7_ASBVE|nr:hypothetical protein BDFB_000080 [Asbolus verrucosus]